METVDYVLWSRRIEHGGCSMVFWREMHVADFAMVQGRRDMTSFAPYFQGGDKWEKAVRQVMTYCGCSFCENRSPHGFWVLIFGIPIRRSVDRGGEDRGLRDLILLFPALGTHRISRIAISTTAQSHSFPGTTCRFRGSVGRTTQSSQLR